MPILNPMMHELFMPLLLTFSSLLGIGLAGVLAGMLLVKDPVLKRQLILRWFSWALITPLTMLAILSGPLVFACLCALVSIICVGEFCQISKRGFAERAILSAAAALMPLVACYSVQIFAGLFLLAALLLALVSFRKSPSFQFSSVSLVALAYVPLLASHAVLLDKLNSIGPALLISIITGSAVANIAAFVFGKLLAGPKLAPAISPNKTWSGVAGSVCGAYLGFLLLSCATRLNLPLLETLLIPLVVAVAGVLGDLFESFLKRSFHVKDAGGWLPGFGGALDRVDGLLFVVPCVYYLVSPAL